MEERRVYVILYDFQLNIYIEQMNIRWMVKQSKDCVEKKKYCSRKCVVKWQFRHCGELKRIIIQRLDSRAPPYFLAVSMSASR